jgi:hypothetical protein
LLVGFSDQQERKDMMRVNQMKNYRKKQLQPMEPWTTETSMDGVSVSDADKVNGSPKDGDMIAMNPSDESDRWLVAAAFFAANYEEA